MTPTNVHTHAQFFPNQYRDSVALMQLSARLARLPGILEASAQMATCANLELIQSAGMIDELPEARPNDIFLIVRGDQVATAAAVEAAAALLSEKANSDDGELRSEPLRSVQMAFAASSGRANLALISTPGDYAAAEAMKALKLGMNAMLFSDNVSVEAEVALKLYAQPRKLLVMGPDCGTAIIDGIPLAFANVVRRGDIGVIGASGTGIQQVTCLIDQAGGGITHAIGTGGHDLSEAVGGITMLSALEQLAADPAARVIVLISKPPAASVTEKIIASAKSCGKPVVVCFLGIDFAAIRAAGLTPAATLDEAARLAIMLSTGLASPDHQHEAAASYPRAGTLAARLTPGQTKLRGLYTGGTFCYEALMLLQDHLPGLHSNTPFGTVVRLPKVWKSIGNTIIDLGDDEFTRGRPHPMIDPSLRNERLLDEAADPEVAIVLLDFVLGYGAHDDPAGQIVASLATAREDANRAGREVLFVGHVCGTAGDPQGLARQTAILTDAGVELTTSNAEAVALCLAILAIHQRGA